MGVFDKPWKCKICGKEMSPVEHSPTQLYCSEACARKAHRKSEYNKLDEKRRTMSARERLTIYLTYNLSCAICGFTVGNFWNLYSAAFQYVFPNALDLLPKEDADKHKIGLNGANGGCEIHHIISIKDGGDNSRENLILLCPNCHKKAHYGIISKDKLIANRITISDEILSTACFAMIADISDGKIITDVIENNGKRVVEYANISK